MLPGEMIGMWPEITREGIRKFSTEMELNLLRDVKYNKIFSGT